MIKEAVKKLVDGIDLTGEEAAGAMNDIMSGTATSSQIAGFLVALRMKGETVDEIVALAKTMRNFAIKIKPAVNSLTDIVGTGGDTIKTINISTIASFVIAAAGIYVAKHGNRAASGKCGSADVLERLGYKLDTQPDMVQRCIESVGIGFMFAPIFHPAMKNAVVPRKELGVRTTFNLLGPLTNPAGAESLVIGVPSLDLVQKIAKCLKALGTKNAMVVHGVDGLDEFSTIGNTHVIHLQDGAFTARLYSPADLGLRRASVNEIVGEDIDSNAKAAYMILANRTKEDAKVQAVIANAAAGFVVAKKAKDLKEGVQIARDTLSSGKCIDKLKSMISFTKGDVSKIEQFQTAN
ncbi:MAG: anthranilate phosphoribosyltransferase [Thaumarchaeota archaeon]|nr:anthranilate phosphoribosyltransferase [Nitrososphaerota archaeon]